MMAFFTFTFLPSADRDLRENGKAREVPSKKDDLGDVFPQMSKLKRCLEKMVVLCKC